MKHPSAPWFDDPEYTHQLNRIEPHKAALTNAIRLLRQVEDEKTRSSWWSKDIREVIWVLEAEQKRRFEWAKQLREAIQQALPASPMTVFDNLNNLADNVARVLAEIEGASH